MIRRHIIFYGRVQDVGFRYFSAHRARELGLTGWVRNLYDGTVEMEVQGEEGDIDLLIRHLKENKWIWIQKMDVKNLPVISEQDFRERW